MLNLKLTIFELTEEQQKAIDKADEMEITIETNLEDCDKVEMTFYNIDFVKPQQYVDDVIEEYHYDGTITVYSRMNKTK